MFDKRKSLWIIVFLLGISMILAGAGEAAKPQQEEPVTIEFWDMQQSDLNILAAQEAALAQFEEENPNIKVNVTVFPYPEYRDKLLIAVQGGKAPDISTLDQIWTSEFAAAEAIIPLDDYIAVINKHVTNRFFLLFAKWLPPFAIVNHLGRRSGRRYRTPILAFPTETGFVFVLTYGRDVDWVRNLMASDSGRLEAEA